MLSLDRHGTTYPSYISTKFAIALLLGPFRPDFGDNDAVAAYGSGRSGSDTV